jgi:hypothetical protein
MDNLGRSISLWLIGVKCKKSGESTDHFLLHYEIATALWNTIFNSVGLACVMPR